MLDNYNGFLGPIGDENRSDEGHDHGGDKDYSVGSGIPRSFLDGNANDFFTFESPSDMFGLSVFAPMGGFGTGGTGVFATGAGTTTAMDGEIAGDTSTTARIDVNGSVSSSIEELNDTDWFAIDLEAGVTYTFFQIRSGDNTALTDPFLYLYNSTGTEIMNNDDILDADGDAVNRNSAITFTPDASGTYYLGAAAFRTSLGDYTLYANEGSFRPTVDLDTQANFLTDGFDNRAAWGTNTIVYDVSALSEAEAVLAIAAMALFADVTPLNFVAATEGQVSNLTFTNDEEGAFASTQNSNSVITSSTVNVSAVDWIETYGTEFNSYSYQTYIHEVGHALGLGHGGPYNGTANFGIDNIFANDLWQYTVMSYNDQGEGLNADNGTPRLVLGLQMVDIIAIQNLYGANPNGTRADGTVYGFNTDIGGMFDFAAFQAQGIRPPSLAIYDTGGVDTLDLSGYSSTQVISLLPGSFSSVGDNTNLNDGSALINNLSIDRTTIIEIAIGGSGNDNIIGNDADNILAGRDGNDAILGNGGDDTIFTDAGDDVVSGGDGADTLLGGEGNDVLSGDGGNDILNGGAGDDNVNGNDGDDMLTGGAGNDSVNGGEGADEVFGNLGNDTVSGNNGDDIVAGEQGDDTINGDAGNDRLGGDEGNDTLNGGDGDDQLDGGIGNDILNGGAGTDSIFAGDGNDNILGGDDLDFLYGQAGDDAVIGGGGDDVMFGGLGVDTMLGGTGADQIFGEDGNDIILGDEGNDVLDGGAGNDILVGGTGANTVTTGTGSDLVIVNAAIVVDVITDFDVANDKIRVDSTGGFDNFNKVQAVFVQNGVDTIIAFGNGASVTLQGVTASSLTAANFEFLIVSGQEKVDTDLAVNTALGDSFDFKGDITPVSDVDNVSFDGFGTLDKMLDIGSAQELASIRTINNPFFDGPLDEDTYTDMFDFG